METTQECSYLCPVIQSLLAASIVIFIFSKLLTEEELQIKVLVF